MTEIILCNNVGCNLSEKKLYNLVIKSNYEELLMFWKYISGLFTVFLSFFVKLRIAYGRHMNRQFGYNVSSTNLYN